MASEQRGDELSVWCEGRGGVEGEDSRKCEDINRNYCKRPRWNLDISPFILEKCGIERAPVKMTRSDNHRTDSGRGEERGAGRQTRETRRIFLNASTEL